MKGKMFLTSLLLCFIVWFEGAQAQAITSVREIGEPVNVSATGLVRGGQGRLLGVFVASSSSGTIKLWDAATATGKVIVNTFSAVGATFYPIPAEFQIGLFLTLGGTADVTFFVTP